MQAGSGGLATAGNGMAGRRTRGLTWWLQFPAPLRELASLRLIGSIGAGAVLYLTPLVFHQEAFSASSVTLGLAIAALAGTLGRFLSGLLLDRGVNCGIPVLLSCFAALAADSSLFSARSFPAYAQGQVLMGIAMGLYWPAIELAIPLGCRNGSPAIPSARGFALARTADAAGVALGALIGALLASRGQLRGIYLLDMLCLSAMVVLLLLRRLPDPPSSSRDRITEAAWRKWLPPLLPVLLITLLATALPALMQSALPLDLVRGGLRRAAMPAGLGALLIGLQLALLLLLQWPVGQWLARRPVATGLGLSLACFALGTAVLAFSALSSQGLWLVALAQLPLALGLAAFLPTATEAVIELTPAEHQGVAMALFSQCFALSSLLAPPLAGLALDRQGHGGGLWLLFTLLCLAGFNLAKRLRPAASAG
jgi:MFS family permease